MGLAILEISCSFLAAALNLPDTAAVLYSVQPKRGGTICLVVESPDVPETKEGDNLPTVAPEYQTEWQSIPVSTKLTSWGVR